MYKRAMYSEISSLIMAMENCERKTECLNLSEWYNKHQDNLEKIEKKFLPSGSGVDSGCKVNTEKSSRNRIQIDFGYHCMNSNGCYDGWIEYKLIVKADLFSGITLNIVGRDYNGVKEYLYEMFDYTLNRELGIENGEYFLI